ncbi:NADPH-dependent 7-cyano-7-deazaguanine reductase QueF [bacterium]|nr:NADPH-dependent 7-cyano-7-deazaguanine reductase QueF [bacterium]
MLSVKRRYTDKHAKAGVKEKLPDIECWVNQFKNYEITIVIPEFTSICPKTGLPDFGTIIVKYMPLKHCLELKSLKLYIGEYRNLGIFHENAVNCILQDVVKAAKPEWVNVSGEFNFRGGIKTIVEAKYYRKSQKKRK